VNKSATKMGKRGFEETPDSADKTHFASVGGAESVAVAASADASGSGTDAPGGPDDAGLAAVVEAWPILSAAARRVVLGIVDDARRRAEPSDQGSERREVRP
jgi:hypothetical protein